MTESEPHSATVQGHCSDLVTEPGKVHCLERDSARGWAVAVSVMDSVDVRTSAPRSVLELAQHSAQVSVPPMAMSAAQMVMQSAMQSVALLATESVPLWERQWVVA